MTKEKKYMKQYHKIQTVYNRNPEDNYKTLVERDWSKPEFELLKDINWLCTEKIDGMNIRVIWDGHNLIFKGKGEKSEIPSHLLETLEELFTPNKMADVFSETHDICLYGEGYGYKIQKGHNYLPQSTNFTLFDVKIGDWWLTREGVEEIANNIGVNIVPILGVWKLEEAIEYVKKGFYSTIADNKNYIAEGLIMKPKTDLFNRKGERIVTKIKHSDFNKIK